MYCWLLLQIYPCYLWLVLCSRVTYDTRNRSTSVLWDITWALWIWTACVCAGSASPTNQPGQQSRSAERVSVLLWGAGGLCQKGLEKSFDLWLDLLLKILCIYPDLVHISLTVSCKHASRFCRSFQKVCSPRWPKSSNCRSMTLWRCPHVWTKTNWRTTLNSAPVMRYNRYILYSWK